MSTPNERYGMSYWYAFGRLDGSKDERDSFSASSSQVAHVFAAEQERAQSLFNSGESLSLESIQGAWEKFSVRNTWREATEDETQAWLSGDNLMRYLEARETEHGLEVRPRL